MTTLRHTLRVAAACAAGTVALAGCGIVSGLKTTKTVHLQVTDDFGAHTLRTASVPKLTGVTGALGFTRRFATVTAQGRRITSVDGHAATGADRWTLYLNGIDAGGPDPQLHDGDHVWWDLHDTSAAADVPAIVGEYPEPFTNGTGGRTFPTVLTCANGLTGACDTVTRELDHVGIKVSFQGLGTGSGSDSLALLVGTYTQLRGVIASELLSAGPSASGVYAKFAGPRNNVIEIENASGSVTRTLEGSYGLIAATEEVGYSEPVWLITGTDKAGVSAAAKALNTRSLANHFAVAVTTGGAIIPLPAN